MKRSFLFRFLFRRIRSFARSESGMTLPLLAVSMVAITGMTGLAIDTARLQLVQSKLQFSLDAAGLAAGSTVSTTSLTTEVTQYLNVNFNGYMGATLSGVTASSNSNNTVITVGATASLPSTFMSVIGVNTMQVSATSQITRAVTGLELVMVLDNTGSMANSAGGGVSKISALQTAANSLITTLFNGQSTSTNGKLWVGIVPFSQTVNIGTSHPTWMNTTYDASLLTMPIKTYSGNGPGWGPTSWGGCVDARKNGEDVTDDPPNTSSTQTLFDQYYWTSDNLNTDGVSNSGYNDWATPSSFQKCVKSGSKTTCSTATSCTPNSTTTCTVTAYKYASTINTTTAGPNLLCPQQVTPMTNNATTLTTAINAMTPEGDTLINQGLEWGWNMISPRWQGLWGGTMNTNGLPLAYGTTGMNKAIVLLTDGENTIDNTAHGAYWFVGDDWLGTTDSNTGVTDLNNKTLQLCTAMKNKGIYIYTIALGTDTTPTSLALLQSCATAQNYYFNSPSTTQLSSIFSAIGDSLSNLRVSQ